MLLPKVHLWCMQLFSLSAAITEPIYHGQNATDYLQSKVNPVLTKALTHLSKQKPEDPLVRTYVQSLIAFSKWSL